MSWWVWPLIKREWWRSLLRLMRKRGKRWCLDLLVVVVLAVLLKRTAWCIRHLGVSCADHNSSRIGVVAHNSNRGSSSNSRNSNSSIILLLHCNSRQPSGRHSSFPPATFHASTIRRWTTLLKNAASPSKATHHELRHHELAVLTTPPWRRFAWEKKC
jgi:hypothetical protein